MFCSLNLYARTVRDVISTEHRVYVSLSLVTLLTNTSTVLMFHLDEINVEMYDVKYITYFFKYFSTMFFTISAPESCWLLSTTRSCWSLSSPHSVSISSMEEVKTQPLQMEIINKTVIRPVSRLPVSSGLVGGDYADSCDSRAVGLLEILNIRLPPAVTDNPHRKSDDKTNCFF